MNRARVEVLSFFLKKDLPSFYRKPIEFDTEKKRRGCQLYKFNTRKHKKASSLNTAPPKHQKERKRETAYINYIRFSILGGFLSFSLKLSPHAFTTVVHLS
jgi:hypothetical protein